MSINFKYTVWVESIIRADKHKIDVFTETDEYYEFLCAVYNVISFNWKIKSYTISWEDTF